MKYIALDIESIGTKPYGGVVWSLALNYGNKKIDLYENCFGNVVIPSSVKKDLADDKICKVIHYGSFDSCYLLMVKGITIRNIWCTGLTETVIHGYTPPSRKKKKDGTVNYTPQELKLQKAYGTQLKFVLPRYGFPSPNKDIRNNFIDRPKGLAFTREEREYMADDVRNLLEVRKAQEYLLRRDSQLEVALLEHKTVEKMVLMKARGVNFNSKLWRTIALSYEAEYKKRLKKLPSFVANWNSPKQIKDYFRSIGIHIESLTDLEDIHVATKNKTLKSLIEARELHKMVTTYGMNWFEEGYIDGDGRVRGDFTQIKETGRMSSHNPNLQNIPKKPKVIELGDHRECFIASKGCRLVIGDFSGQEIGIMAAMADEKLWIDALLRGDDIHGLTASLLYQAEWDRGYEKGCKFPKKCECHIHQELREKAKTLNFMLAYGGGPKKFAFITGVTFQEALIVVKRYKRIIPRITKTLERNGKDALYTGESFSADPYRRRRLLMGDKDWHIINQGKNNPIQAAGANMLKLAMISIPDSLPIVLVIHDEIVTDPFIKDAPKAVKILKQVMEKSADYITGISGLIKVEPRISLTLAKPRKKNDNSKR